MLYPSVPGQGLMLPVMVPGWAGAGLSTVTDNVRTGLVPQLLAAVTDTVYVPGVVQLMLMLVPLPLMVPPPLTFQL
jgi:hypothetical protein